MAIALGDERSDVPIAMRDAVVALKTTDLELGRTGRDQRARARSRRGRGAASVGAVSADDGQDRWSGNSSLLRRARRGDSVVPAMICEKAEARAEALELVAVA